MLGLSGEPTQDDNLFKRLFWPSNNPTEVDTLGQQGFWICLIVGLVSTVASLLTGHPLLGLLLLVFYWLGGMGVREYSVWAAVSVALAYAISLVLSVFTRHMPGIIDVIIEGLLLANIRGTYIASQWKKRADPSEFPDRLNTLFWDKVVDQIPQKVWPVGRYIFFVVGLFYLALLLLSTVGVLYRQSQMH